MKSSILVGSPIEYGEFRLGKARIVAKCTKAHQQTPSDKTNTDDIQMIECPSRSRETNNSTLARVKVSIRQIIEDAQKTMANESSDERHR